jgi:hypothetical protein
MTAENIRKYLQKYSWGDYQPLLPVIDFIDTIVVIPAIAEYENAKLLLQSLAVNDPARLAATLFLFVVNRTMASTEAVSIDNQLLLAYLEQMRSKQIEDPALHIGYIDASTGNLAFPESIGGVGLARKIGMDAALSLFSRPDGRNCLICLDADCTVPDTYLSAIHQTFTANRVMHAAVIQYEHRIGNGLEEFDEAIVCYELFLRHYTVGLLAAASPYAFHSIGSAMLCDPETYIKCEGMNKKKAGEDFYFLEKIAKTEDIYTINTTRVFPSPRPSWRVPFGTGQRVNRFLNSRENEYLVYAPDSFIVLRKFLNLLRNTNESTVDLLRKSRDISEHLFNFLEQQKFASFREKINTLPEKQYTAQVRFWFDGFRTLKLMHYLRDTGYPLEPMFSAIPETMRLVEPDNKAQSWPSIPSFAEQLRLLHDIRAISMKHAAHKVD